jgi:hypothetical protein
MKNSAKNLFKICLLVFLISLLSFSFKIFKNSRFSFPALAQILSGGSFTVKKADNCPCTCPNGACEECFGGFCCDGKCQTGPCNTLPSIAAVFDNPDPQKAGFQILFSSKASDPDVGDTLKLYICKDAFCQNCSPNLTTNCLTASSSWYFTDPQASYACPLGEYFSQNYWAKVCDSKSGCSQIISGGSFTCQKEDGASCKNNEECFGGFCCKDLGCQSSPCPPTNLSHEWYYCVNDLKPQFFFEVPFAFDEIRLQIATKEDFSPDSIVFDSGEISWSWPRYPYTIQGWETLPKWQDDHPKYNQTYFWRVKVKTEGKWSFWSNAQNFQTPPQGFPKTDFIWWPKEISLDEEVSFFDKTKFDPQSDKSWEWIIPDAECSENPECPCSLYPFCQNPKVKFKSAGAKTVTLKATNKNLKLEDKTFGCGPGCCKISKGASSGITVRLPLPIWKEVPPTLP